MESYLDEDKRRVKVTKLQEKLQALLDERDIVESLKGRNERAAEKAEQLEFDFGKSA